MKGTLLIVITLTIVGLSGFALSTRAQGPTNQTATKMIYHDGPVVTDTPYVSAAKVAHVLSTIVTNPYGDGWYDRFGLENADKCQGTFGESYLTSNGARANIRVGQRDFLVEQNWVNDRRGNRCALSQ